MIEDYRKRKLKEVDKKMLRSIFMRNIKDFDEDYNEHASQQSLLERLRGNLEPQPSDPSFFNSNSSIDNTSLRRPSDQPYHQHHQKIEFDDYQINKTN